MTTVAVFQLFFFLSKILPLKKELNRIFLAIVISWSNLYYTIGIIKEFSILDHSILC